MNANETLEDGEEDRCVSLLRRQHRGRQTGCGGGKRSSGQGTIGGDVHTVSKARHHQITGFHRPRPRRQATTQMRASAGFGTQARSPLPSQRTKPKANKYSGKPR